MTGCSTVTVSGGCDKVISIPIGSAANAVIAQQLLGSVTDGINQGSITPYQYSGSGKLHAPKYGIGSLDLTGPGTVSVPANTTSVVVPNAPPSCGTDHGMLGGQANTIFGGQAKEQLVVSGDGGIKYTANVGIGTVIAGGGNNIIKIGANSGDHLVLTDKGNDSIYATGGDDTVGAGLGRNWIELGSGNDSVDVTGWDTIKTGTGADTVTVEKGGRALVHGGCGPLTFVDNGKASTVFGGSANDTMQAGSGRDLFSGGKGADQFVFAASVSGGHTEIKDFTLGKDTVVLEGYSQHDLKYALKTVTSSCGSITLTLSDKTTITFDGVDQLNKSSFKLT
jgi:Ca2+-binding RTX toxin-like protein